MTKYQAAETSLLSSMAVDGKENQMCCSPLIEGELLHKSEPGTPNAILSNPASRCCAIVRKEGRLPLPPQIKLSGWKSLLPYVGLDTSDPHALKGEISQLMQCHSKGSGLLRK